MTDLDLSGVGIQRRTYLDFLEVVADVSGDPDHPLVAGTHLWDVCRRRNWTMSHAIAAMDAALANDHVVSWIASDGTPRYGVTTGGVEWHPRLTGPLYGDGDVAALRGVADSEAVSASPNQGIVQWANRHLDAIDSEVEA
mgnify:FL=1